MEGSPLVNADGIVLYGHHLYVVQNFSRQITKLRLSGDWSSAEVGNVLPTPADCTSTTAKIARGQLLVVDSKFGFPPAAAVAEDRVVPIDLFWHASVARNAPLADRHMASSTARVASGLLG